MKVEQIETLRHQTEKILAEQRLTKEPVLITEEGQPAAYLIDAQIYESMQRRLAIWDALSRGEMAFEGWTYSHDEAREKMAKWLK